MKRILYLFAVAVLAMALVSCEREDPERKKVELDHFELKIDLTYAKDIVDNFDLSYTVTSGRTKVASGTITSTTSNILVNKGITTGNLDINITPKAKSGFPEVGKIYDFTQGSKITLDVFTTDGRSSNLADVTRPVSSPSYILEDIADKDEFISVMEAILVLKQSFTVYREGDEYFAY